MKNSCLLFLLVLLAFSCNSKVKEVPVKEEKKELVMVKPSEMANLMNEMYAYNEAIKQQILNGELKSTYPDRFNNIHTAILTDNDDRDEFFNTSSEFFLQSEAAIFESPQDSLIHNYNNAINACITCHNKKCAGPIPRIKKLLITK